MIAHVDIVQYGGSPVKVGEEEYSLFRDHEYVAVTELRFQCVRLLKHV